MLLTIAKVVGVINRLVVDFFMMVGICFVLTYVFVIIFN